MENFSKKVLETRQCKNCSASFNITDQDRAFYAEMKVPAPTFCPDCRQQRRLSFRNERVLYKRKCDATGKLMVSIYSEDKPIKVFDNDHWYSDAWNPMDYAKDFDFNRTFSEQFEELWRDVPQLARSTLNNQ